MKRLVKAKRKRQKSKAKRKRSVAKKSASRPPMTPTQRSLLQTETTIVDVIEERVQGIVVVTEFEETHTRRLTRAATGGDGLQAAQSRKRNSGALGSNFLLF